MEEVPHIRRGKSKRTEFSVFRGANYLLMHIPEPCDFKFAKFYFREGDKWWFRLTREGVRPISDRLTVTVPAQLGDQVDFPMRTHVLKVRKMPPDDEDGDLYEVTI